MAVVTISSGHSPDYLLNAVATGRENYYTGAVAAGEPPGRWYGHGAAALGLAGEVDAQEMTALYERFLDPRGDAFGDPARWDDEDAERLGHAGRRYLSEDEIYQASLAAEPDSDAERRAELRLEAGKKARKNVAFLDATFSVQKSVTVLHAAFEAQEVRARGVAEQARGALTDLTDDGGGGAPVRAGAPGAVHLLTAEVAAAEAEANAWAEHRRAIEDAIWAGNQAALEYLSGKAGYSRVGHHGGAAGRWIDAHDWTIASFFQHDSRNHDPQLHIHNAILNRVEGVDGKWRTLDSKAIHKYRGAASVVGDRVMEHHLTRALGVEFATRPDGKAREITGIDPAVLELFSSRRRAITRRTGDLVAAFETRFGRAPNALERDRLQRTATFASRKAKSHDGETGAERLERWDAQLRSEVAGGLARVADTVLTQARDRGDRQPVRWSPREVIETALAEVQETKAAWTAPDLTRAISNALPDDLGDLEPEQVEQVLDGLTAEALDLAVPLDAPRPGEAVLPDELRLADGSSAYQAPGAQLYATPEHLRTERLLAAAAVERDAPALPPAAAEVFLAEFAETGVELGADQAHALRGILTSGARVESLVGPAGTGKSFVVGGLAKAWQDQALWGGERRRVVGLASSQIAADVLAAEGLNSHNITRWLNAQTRITHGSTRAEDLAWALQPGDLVVVDESAMTNTSDLARIHRVCGDAGAKLLLVGDHRQLAAVGAAGGMELAAGGVRHELSETRRFIEPWEGLASLRLRDRDQSVLAEYHKHGRLVDGGAAEQAEAAARRGWLADTLAGRRAILVVDSNEQAAQVSAELRAELVRLGRVDDSRTVRLGLQDTYAGRGDLVQARRNAWDLAGYRGNRRGPINRESFRVVDTTSDGGFVVAPILARSADGEELGDRISLPAAYVTEHVALGYAFTVHAAQGLTVDTSHAIVTGRTSPEALYVGLSRGRHANTAYVVTRAVPDDDAPTGAVNDAVHRSPQAVLAGVFENADPQLSALAEAAESEAETERVRTPGELFAAGAEIATAHRTAQWLDELVADGSLTERQRGELAAEDGANRLNYLLRRVELAGHDPRQRLVDAIGSRDLDDARQLSSVLHARIMAGTSLDPVGDAYHKRIPEVGDPQWRTYLTTLADVADARQGELGQRAVEEPPQWAIEALGPVPAPGTEERSVWERSAGAVASYRELIGQEDPADALGPAPKAGQVEAYAAWRAAWRALGRPEADRVEAEMSTGQLRVRVRAYERERTWAPAYVADELAATRQAADRHRHDAQLRRAESAAAADENDRHGSVEQASQSTALAEALLRRADALAAADQARGAWYAHTAETRAAADRAQAELSAREIATDEPDDRVTAEEWLATHQAADQAEDRHREIRNEHDLADADQQRAQDRQAAGLDLTDQGHAEVAPVDIRGATAATAPDDDQHDAVRVPTAAETADAVDRARRALLELHQRTTVEEQRAREEAEADQVAAWHAIDRDDPTPTTAKDTPDTSTSTSGDAPAVLEHSSPLDD